MGSSSQKRHARFYPIVDVLRALAVVSVVAYHAGIGGVSGGYVGVDVFFVISGFLIIGQIVEERRRGHFSFAAFWARRALRILPSYLLVIVVSTAIASYVLVMPEEFLEYGRQLAWSAAMMVNHLFLAEQGYFDAAAETKPLLHLWSLAVEEQFYLFAPLVVGGLFWLATGRRPHVGRRLTAILVATMFMASFALCVAYTGVNEDDKNYAFYLMPLRAWEFIVGGFLPMLVPSLRALSVRQLTLLMIAGFGLILIAIFTFDHSTPFPSWRASLPVAGSGLVIACGLARDDLPLIKWLGCRPVLVVGLLSYSWYLWHWPLMAFARIYNFGSLPVAWGVGLAFLSLLLAALTYRMLELPIKQWRIRTRPYLGLRPTLAGILGCLVIGLAGGGLSKVQAERVAAMIPDEMIPTGDRNARDCALHRARSTEACSKQLQREGRHTVGAVLGDSHAIAAFSSVRDLAHASGSSLISITRVGCVPIVGVHLYYSHNDELYNCHQVKERAFNYIFRGQLRPSFALIYAHWNNAAPWYRLDGSLGPPYRYVVDAGRRDRSDEEAFVYGMRRTLKRLKAAGVKRIMIISSTPEFIRSPPSCLIRADRYGVDRDQYCSVSADLTMRRRHFSTGWLMAAVQGVAEVRVIDPMPVFCDTEYCRPYDDTGVLYRDDDHLTKKGMEKIIDRYSSDFRWLLGH